MGLCGSNWPAPLLASAPANPKQIRACIVIFHYGGPSHLDTFDMKPSAPAEVRGQFGSIATSAPGVRFCEHLPYTARVADKLAVLRGVHHAMTNHNAAAVEALCGRAPLRGDLELLADDELSFPCHGAVLDYLWRSGGSSTPSVALPHVMYNVVRLPGQSAGLLGPAYQPLHLEADPNSPAFSVRALELPESLSMQRLADREKLMRSLDGAVRPDKSGQAMQAFYDRALALLRSDVIRRGLNVDAESPKTRDHYGRTTHGQSLLLARRLVESGVRYVAVYDGVVNGQDANWDRHASVFPRLKDHLLPPSDRAFAALIDDLHARGLLESTLVMKVGEFGRSPKINSSAGRDHWPNCYSVVLAGGGVRGGITYGSSDRIGAYPASDAVTPGDLAATLYWRFGLDYTAEVHDRTGRPFQVAAGEPIRRLFEGV
jgi:hypothetical protein